MPKSARMSGPTSRAEVASPAGRGRDAEAPYRHPPQLTGDLFDQYGFEEIDLLWPRLTGLPMGGGFLARLQSAGLTSIRTSYYYAAELAALECLRI